MPYISNLSQELVPVTGVSDVSLSVTGTSALLTGGVTLNAGTEIVQVQPQGGDIRYTVDGTAPTTTTGFLLEENSLLQMHLGSAQAFRYCRNGSDSVTLLVSQLQYATNSTRRSADLSIAMESTPFKTIVKWILGRWNAAPTAWLSSGDTSADEKQALVDLVNANVRQIWNRGPWPGITLTEEREVDTTPGYNLVPYNETGYLNLGKVYGVWSKDPRDNSTYAFPIPFQLGNAGLVLPAEYSTSVWVQHRIRTHEFTLEAYSSGTTYAAGALVYYDTTGECYRRLSAGSGVSPVDVSTWEVMRVPAIFTNFVLWQSTSDWLSSKQPKDAARWAERADQALFDAEATLPTSRNRPAFPS